MASLAALVGFGAAGCSWPTVAKPVPPQDLTVTIATHPAAGTSKNPNRVQLHFRNRTAQTIHVLRPLIGSMWGRDMPHYQLVVSDGEGNQMALPPLRRTNGLLPGRQWPADYLIEVKPKSVVKITIGLPHRVPYDGRYWIGFEYVYWPANPGWGVAPQAWQGSTRAEPVWMDLKKN